MFRIRDRIRTAALRRGADDAKANADGIGGNEHRPEGAAPPCERQPFLARTKVALQSLTTAKDDKRLLADLIAGFGGALTTLDHPLADDFFFQAEKAIALTRFKRKPSEVV